jgi:Zn finger protein HypA/HybF involved in hydrogenase expression
MDILKDVGGFFGTTKLNRQVAREEERVEKLESEIGALVYQKFTRGEKIEDELVTHCQEIAKLRQGIEDLQEKIRQLKGLKKCLACRAEIDEEQTFCSKCGAKQEEQVIISAAETTVVEASPKKNCVACNQEIRQDQVFCPHCGAKQSPSDGNLRPNLPPKPPVADESPQPPAGGVAKASGGSRQGKPGNKKETLPAKRRSRKG